LRLWRSFVIDSDINRSSLNIVKATNCKSRNIGVLKNSLVTRFVNIGVDHRLRSRRVWRSFNCQFRYKQIADVVRCCIISLLISVSRAGSDHGSVLTFFCCRVTLRCHLSTEMLSCSIAAFSWLACYIAAHKYVIWPKQNYTTQFIQFEFRLICQMF